MNEVCWARMFVIMGGVSQPIDASQMPNPGSSEVFTGGRVAAEVWTDGAAHVIVGGVVQPVQLTPSEESVSARVGVEESRA